MPIYKVRRTRRCVTATYSYHFTQVLPVNPVAPVNRMDRFTPHDKKKQQQKKDRRAFSSMLNELLQTEDSGTSSRFDAFA